MFRVINVILLLTLFSTHAVFGQNATQECANSPKWILNPPVSDVFIYSTATGSSIEEAKHEAKKNLALEISVHVQGRIARYIEETNSTIESKTVDHVQLSSDIPLVGHDIVDTWYCNGLHFVLYRLNIDEYRSTANSRIEELSTIATRHLLAADSLLQRGQFLFSMESVLTSFELIQEAKDWQRIVPDNTGLSLLEVDLMSWIKQTIRDTEIDRIVPGEKISLRPSGKSSLRIKATLNSLHVNSSPINLSQMPIRYSFDNSGENDLTVVTDDRGEAELSAASIPTTKVSATLFAQLDTRIFDASNFPIEKVSVPSFAVGIEFDKLRSCIASKETIEGYPSEDNYLLRGASQYLHDTGFDVINNPTNRYCDLTIDIEANARRGSRTAGLYSAYVSGQIVVRDLQGRVLSREQIINVKGIGSSYRSAIRKAFGQAVDPVIYAIEQAF